MALVLNQPVFHRSLGAAHSGHIDHGDPTPPERSADNSIGHDPDAIPSEKHKHPIIGHDGKVIAKGIDAAHEEATKNGDSAILPALKKIADAIAAQGGEKNLSRESSDTLTLALEVVGKLADRMNLSGVTALAQCPDCGSYDMEPKGAVNACQRCGNSHPQATGTVTSMQFNKREMDNEAPSEKEDDQDDDDAPEYLAQQNSAPASDLNNGIAAYDPEFATTREFVDTAQGPSGGPNLKSQFARTLFGIH